MSCFVRKNTILHSYRTKFYEVSRKQEPVWTRFYRFYEIQDRATPRLPSVFANMWYESCTIKKKNNYCLHKYKIETSITFNDCGSAGCFGCFFFTFSRLWFSSRLSDTFERSLVLETPTRTDTCCCFSSAWIFWECLNCFVLQP